MNSHTARTTRTPRITVLTEDNLTFEFRPHNPEHTLVVQTKTFRHPEWVTCPDTRVCFPEQHPMNNSETIYPENVRIIVNGSTQKIMYSYGIEQSKDYAISYEDYDKYQHYMDWSDEQKAMGRSGAFFYIHDTDRHRAYLIRCQSILAKKNSPLP